jgi:hypothetical protein
MKHQSKQITDKMTQITDKMTQITELAPLTIAFVYNNSYLCIIR